MKLYLILLVTLAALTQANISQAKDWTTSDTVLEATYLSTHLLDWKQTRYITKHSQYCEVNPILGKYPHVDKVDGYFLVTALGHVAISYLLPKNYRHAWQAATIGLEVMVVKHNYEMGIRVNF